LSAASGVCRSSVRTEKFDFSQREGNVIRMDCIIGKTQPNQDL
jgi:hypothetical protein